MADGSVVIETKIDDKKAQEKLTKLNQKIERIKSNLAESESNKNVIESQLNESKKAALSAEKSIEKYTEYLKESTAATGGNDPFSDQWARRLEESKKELAEQDKITQKLAAKYSSIVDKVAIQKAELNSAKEAAAEQQAKVAGVQFPESVLDAEKRFRDVAEDAGQALENVSKSAAKITPEIKGAETGTRKLSPAAEKAEKSFNKLAGRIKGLAKRVFIFTIITAALRKIREYMWSAIQTNTDAMAAVAKLKGALRTLAQPIVNIVIPAFTLLANVLTTVVNTAARLLSALFGNTLASSQKAAESLYDQQKAIDGVGSAAKKASKYLAPFDELNTMNGDSDSSGGASASGGIAPDFTSTVSSGLTAVATLFTGIALLALGAVLTFSGANIPIGIALMVAGALAVYGAASENWGLIAETLQGSLAVIVTIVSGALLALGIILVMTSANIPLGIGMIIAGAASLAAVVAVNWDTITRFISDNIDVIAGIVGAAFLVLGAILALSGANIPLGVGLLLVGAASLAASAAINWEAIQNAMKGPIGAVTAIVGGALLALGAVLLFTGANIPLGIGLIVAGAVVLATAIVPNWDSITQALRGPLGKALAMIGGFLVVLGIILIFTGVGIPLGIGMLLAGGVSLAAAIAPNWNFIIGKIKYVWQKIKEFWNSYIAPVFTAAWWQNLGKNIMNGLISGIERGINWVLGGVSDMVNGITGILNKIPGVNIGQVNWGNVHIPRLAQGAVIPANREFLAVLGDQKRGTNIEAPADLIRQIVREEVKNSGGVGNHITIVLDSVNGKKIFDTVVKENNAVVRATGASPLVV